MPSECPILTSPRRENGRRKRQSEYWLDLRPISADLSARCLHFFFSFFLFFGVLGEGQRMESERQASCCGWVHCVRHLQHPLNE